MERKRVSAVAVLYPNDHCQGEPRRQNEVFRPDVHIFIEKLGDDPHITLDYRYEK